MVWSRIGNKQLWHNIFNILLLLISIQNKTNFYLDYLLPFIYRARIIRHHPCRKTLDNNHLNQAVASSGFSENKGLGGMLSLAGS